MSDLYLDRSEIRLLSSRLRDIHVWAGEALDDAICRIVARGRTPGRRGNDDRPLDLDETASRVAEEVHGTLRTWAEHICVHSTAVWPGEQRIPEWAHFINMRLIDLAKTEEAGAAFDEITDVHQRIMRVIDRPVEPRFVGPCQAAPDSQVACSGVYCRPGQESTHCRTCELDIDVPSVRAATEERMRDTLFTKLELRTALVMFTKEPVKRQTIDAWIRRGRLADHGGGRYRLDEALALVAAHRDRAG